MEADEVLGVSRHVVVEGPCLVWVDVNLAPDVVMVVDPSLVEHRDAALIPVVLLVEDLKKSKIFSIFL